MTEPGPPFIRHNHMTRDIKNRGECPACDEYHDRHPANPAPEEES